MIVVDLILVIPRLDKYVRQIDSEFGKLNIAVPRNRDGEFRTALIPPYTRRVDVLEEMIIKFYEKGMTMPEIADLIKKIYSFHYSASTISNITSAVEGKVMAFHWRKFRTSDYVCLFIFRCNIYSIRS